MEKIRRLFTFTEVRDKKLEKLKQDTKIPKSKLLRMMIKFFYENPSLVTSLLLRCGDDY